MSHTLFSLSRYTASQNMLSKDSLISGTWIFHVVPFLIRAMVNIDVNMFIIGVSGRYRISCIRLFFRIRNKRMYLLSRRTVNRRRTVKLIKRNTNMSSYLSYGGQNIALCDFNDYHKV